MIFFEMDIIFQIVKMSIKYLWIYGTLALTKDKLDLA